jgi:hypothetical protein
MNIRYFVYLCKIEWAPFAGVHSFETKLKIDDGICTF